MKRTDVEIMCRKIMREDVAELSRRLWGTREYAGKYEWTEQDLTMQCLCWRSVARALRKMAGRLDMWAAEAGANLAEGAATPEKNGPDDGEEAYRKMLRRALKQAEMFRPEHWPSQAKTESRVAQAARRAAAELPR